MGELKPINPTKAQIVANLQAPARDYNTLANKPQINGVVLEGDKSNEELGLQGTITAEGYLSVNGGTLSFDDETFMVKRDALPKIGIRDAGQSGFTPVSDDDVSEYTTGVIGQIPVATAGTFFRAYGGDVCTEMYQTVDWKLYVRAYKLVGEHWLGMFWREIGAQGQHGDGYTAAQIDENGDLIVTEVVYSGDNYVTRPVNLGHVVGADGISVTGAAINDQGHLILTLSDGATIDAGYVGTPRTDIAGAVITLSESTYTYDGTSKAPNVTSVTLNGQTLTAGTDYAVVANPATNAGQYVVTVNGIGDYTGTATTEWTITKAQATISGDDSITISGLDESVSKTYTTNGDGAFSFAMSGNVATVTNIGGTVTIIPTAYGTADLTVTVYEGQNYFGTTKTVSVTVEEVQTATVFGVVWDYSLSSPQLARLTPQTDPFGVVTNVPTQEPTACVGNDGNGQSDFDNYMPWAGMQRYNYVNGQVVDFVDYSNGETFIFIPEFWSKIVDDTTNSKMYFYISSGELTGFTKHPGSGRYVGRYTCNSNFKSESNSSALRGRTLANYRLNISLIDNNHFIFDFFTHNAIIMLFIIEWANFNSEFLIGFGNIAPIVNNGQTDVLTFHTGRISGTDDKVPIHYRWIENYWGNVWFFVDGILINDGLVYLCDDPTKYSSSLTADYVSTGLSTPSGDGYITQEHSYNDCCIIPKNIGGSDSTYLCDYHYYNGELRILYLAGHDWSGSVTGMFIWAGDGSPEYAREYLGARSILILGGES